MATCAQIQSDISQLERIVVNGTNLVTAANTARNAAANEGDLATARAKLAEAESGLTGLENARQELLDLADEAVINNCFEQRELAITLVSSANNTLTSLRRNISLAKTAISNIQSNATTADTSRCNALLAERDSIRSSLSSLESQKSQLNLTAANQGLYETNLSKARSIVSQAGNLRDKLTQLKFDVDKNNCTNVSGLNILLDSARRVESETNELIGVLNDAWLKTQQEQAKTGKATETENNAGDGTPGSAPSSSAEPSPDGLEEVSVSAKRAPEPVSEPGVGDGLEEVEVTGKRNPTLISGDPAISDQVDVDIPEPNFDLETDNTNQGLSGATDQARAQATIQDTVNFQLQEDWRVRLQLSPDADYLYKADDPGILLPLQQTNGVIFPYTPTVQVQYAANYEPVDLVHSNYKVFQYRNSGVDTVSITCDFTAQDTAEANYLLAVIHFFRSVTKMFYGQDEQPKPGTPPPLCYLFGLGDFQFNAHPLAISNFTYNLPNNVDYIRASNTTTSPGVSKESAAPRDNTSQTSKARRDQSSTKIGAGGNPQPTQWNGSRTPAGSVQPTYVPTKITISLTAVPIVSRLDISTRFSLKDYATGNLLRGVQNSKGGIW